MLEMYKIDLLQYLLAKTLYLTIVLNCFVFHNYFTV